MSAIAFPLVELLGIQDAAALLREAVSRRAVDRTQTKYRTKLRRVLWRMWRQQRNTVEQSWLPLVQARGILREASGVDGLMQLLAGLLAVDEASWGEELAAVLADVMMVAAQAAIADLKFSFELSTERIEREIRQHAGQLVSGLNLTTREELRSILERAVAERMTYAQAAKLLRNRFREFGALVPLHHIHDRAELIAVTEIGQAYVRGQQQVGNALVAAGVPMDKAWLTAEDDRVEPECEGNGGAGWIPWDESFPSGHDAPLAHPGCRCALQMQRSAE